MHLFKRNRLSNRLEYLASRLIDNNASLVSAFKKMSVTRLQQIQLLELWSSQCEDRLRMSFDEFASLYDFEASSPIVKYLKMIFTDRLFREINVEKADSKSISFASWATGVIRWCHFSHGNTVSLAFRLYSSSGGGVCALESLEADSHVLPCDISPDSLERQLTSSVTPKPMPPPALSFSDITRFFDAIYVPLYGEKICIKPTRSSRIASITRIFGLIDVDNTSGSGIDYNEFRPFAMANPGFLLIAWLLQERMREITLGRQFWEDRLEKTGGKERRHRKALRKKKQKERKRRVKPEDTSRKNGLEDKDEDEDAWIQHLDMMKTELEDLYAMQLQDIPVKTSAEARTLARRFRMDFPDIHSKVLDERDKKIERDNELSNRTLRRAIPSTLWPHVKTTIEIIESSAILDEGEKTEPKEASEPKKASNNRFFTSWGTKRNQPALAKMRICDGVESGSCFEIRLSLSVEISDQAGDWPEGVGLSNRVLIAEDMRHRMIEHESYSMHQHQYEANLNERLRVARGDYIEHLSYLKRCKHQALSTFDRLEIEDDLQVAQKKAQAEAKAATITPTKLIRLAQSSVC